MKFLYKNIKPKDIFPVILSLLLLFPLFINAQSTRGTDFWVGFMENYYGTSQGRLDIFISSDINTSGTVSIPLGGWTQAYTVTANTTTQVTVPSNLAMALGGDVIQGKGVHVEADDTVSVFALNYQAYTSDAANILPTPSLGTEYYVTAYTPAYKTSEFLIAGTLDNTSIEIIPTSATTGGHAAGVPYLITINSGEVYQVQSGGDLTGTHISATPGNGACNVFAVFGGTVCTNVGGCAYCDQLYEEMFPVSTWGKNFITAPLKSRNGGDIFKIVASQNGTSFTINGGAPVNLNAGQSYQTLLTTPSYITSNMPISVAQYSRGGNCDGLDGDPFMIMISPVEQSLDNITFNAFTSSVITAYYVNIITKTANTGLVILDGTPIGGSFNTVPSNPVYSYAQMTITQGNHTLVSDSGLVAYIYGFGDDESYGYPAGASLVNLNNWFSYFVAITPICPFDTINFVAETDSTVISWEWDFGDGDTASGKIVDHFYSDYGEYTVTLVIERLGGCSTDTLTKIILVTGPVATVSGNDTICAGSSAVLTITGDSSVTGYIWSTGETSASITVNPSVTTSYWGAPIAPSCQGEPDSITVNVIQVNSDFSFDTACYFDTTYFYQSASITGDSIISWSWDFGDGSPVDVSQNPSHQYFTLNPVNTELIVTSIFGCSDTAIKSIAFYSLPSANFSNTNVCLNETTQFLSLSTDSSGYIVSWEWDFGDSAGTSTVPNPVYLYDSTGTYTVNLTVTSNYGCSAVTGYIAKVFPLPVANFTTDTVCAKDMLQFNSSLVSSGNIISWNWDFDDGNNSSQQDPFHVYSNGGTYDVTLIVTTNNGCLDTIIKSCEIYYLPFAGFAAQPVCFDNTTVFYDTSGFINDSITSWNWNFGDGSPIDNSQNPTHLYAVPDTFYSTLIITSVNGCKDTVTQPVIVYPLPVASFNNTTVCLNDLTEFFDLSSVINDAIISWQWDFGDGSGTSTNQDPTYTYASEGLDTVQLTVTTYNGCVDSIFEAVEVYSLPVAGFNNTTVCPGFTTLFLDASNGYDYVVSWDWDFGDQTFSTETNPSHTYISEETLDVQLYDVQLIVTNNNGCHDTINKIVTVYPEPIAGFSFIPAITTILFPTITFTNISSGADYSYWNFGDNTSWEGFHATHTYNGTDTGTYTVMLIVENTFTCRDSITNYIVIEGDYTLFVPNSFTPNYDDKNDIFFPQGVGFDKIIQEFNLYIYNRWGDLIYETDDIRQGWDGRANNGNEMAQEDVYVWVILTTDFSKKRHQYIGHVTLIR
ncbi:MAG: PKD domain-containing protein [Bacteroidota bacterium]